MAGILQASACGNGKLIIFAKIMLHNYLYVIGGSLAGMRGFFVYLQQKLKKIKKSIAISNFCFIFVVEIKKNKRIWHALIGQNIAMNLLKSWELNGTM